MAPRRQARKTGTVLKDDPVAARRKARHLVRNTIAVLLQTDESMFINEGYPAAVRTDNGPEFTSRAFIGWAQSHGIRHILIVPGRLMQNGYIESFNGRFRDECLNEHWFEALDQARTEIAAWRRDYNEVMPHGSIGRIPPPQFAQRHRRPAVDSAGL